MSTNEQPATVVSEVQLRAFLRSNYLHERFEGRDGSVWGKYSDSVVRSRLSDLERDGQDFISKYESAHGRVIRYTTDDVLHARIFRGDE